MKLKIVELFIPDTEAELNISVVEQPAIDLNFYSFGKEPDFFMFYDEEKRIVVGPAMIPNKLITRNGKDGPYVCFFSQDTIQKFKQRLLAERSVFSNINHSDELKDIQLIEIWTKDFEIDKSVNYGYKEEPIGTLFAMYKVNCEDTWKRIKMGKLKGFSIEGYFNPEDTGKTIDSKQVIRNQFSTIYEEMSSEQYDILDKILHLKQFRPAIWQELKDDKDFKTKVEEHFETYTDYPDYMKEAAKRGIELNAKVNNKCATQVGKVRAQQLANGEPISLDTIKRIHSYISRAMAYWDSTNDEGCSNISILLWGGPKAGEWAKRKIEQIEKQEMAKEKAITVDIDDTLFIDGKANQGLIDKLNNSSERIIVLTSRTNGIRKSTEKLLHQIGLKYDNLIMRKSGNHITHKIKALQSLIDSYDITASYENNIDVLKEMISLGINAKMPNEFIIEPKSGESEEEFINRCMIVETENYERDQAYAICKNKFLNK